jgi:hypothetical protein
VTALPRDILSAMDAENLVDWCLENIGLGYHPDTVAADYIDAEGRRAFSETEAIKLDRLHEEAFAAGFGERMYDHGVDGMRSIMGLPPVGVT